jgi:2',3'-cyclic-nucleotide 2'-phosphodiesterase (5'-nucleotidase family)
MVKLKNYNIQLKLFVLFLTFTSLISCSHKNYYVTKIEGKEISITDKHPESTEIEKFIKPYRDKIDTDLNTVLAIAPQTLDKNGDWQTPMGVFMSDVTFIKANPVFQSREKKSIDICLLNHGGIRSIIPKGDVTARTAYEVMPFENSAIVIALKGEQIQEIAEYIIGEKKPHPLSGMTFIIDKNSNPSNILVNGKPLDKNKTYHVVTSDYLSNGGDNMTFFNKAIQKYDLEYKLRNIIIDYFKDVETIEIKSDKRIVKE